MPQLNRILVFLTFVLAVTKTTFASFGYCIGITGFTSLFLKRQVVGFKIWNEDGTNASQYRSIYSAKKTNMDNNGWNVWIKVNSVMGAQTFDYGLYGLDITNNKFSISNPLEYYTVCTSPGTYTVAYYYGCYENNYYGFCEENWDAQKTECGARLSMGSD
ncbi:hypothetical protein BGZ46_008939, partial [Entomortierella lignicola]